jgi:uncharacterized protein YkwD
MVDDRRVVPRATLVGCVVALLLAAFLPGTVHSAVGSKTSLAALESGVLAELNQVRAAHGLRPLKLSSELTAAAREHTFDMIEGGYFEHDSANGTPYWKRIERFYSQGNDNVWSVGENLLYCSPTIRAKRALKTWMDSAGHRKNILSTTWREIGIAAVHSTTSRGAFGGGAVTVITTDFGARA